MPSYTAPVRDMQFLLHDVLKVADADTPGYGDLDPAFTSAVLEEAGRLASEVLAPLNPVGDREGCVLENGVVRTPRGFREAFEALKAGGWTALDCDPAYGGQGLPYIMGTAVGEIFVSANMALNMYQGLTRPRDRGAEADLAAQDGQLRLDRHDEPDRAALRHRSGPHAHPRRAAGRRQLPHHRAEDLHLGRRA
jgi:hypothetical protein